MKSNKAAAKKSFRFYQRLYKNALISFVVILFSLSMGVLGYHYIAHLPFIDAVQNASMILTGMGPVNTMPDNPSKIFASAYALFSGITFLTSIAVLFTPMFQRIMHEMNLETMKDEEEEEAEQKHNNSPKRKMPS